MRYGKAVFEKRRIKSIGKKKKRYLLFLDEYDKVHMTKLEFLVIKERG